MESPKSLTAMVHVRFHYRELPSQAPSKSEIEVLGSLLERASKLDPDLQELLVRFADYVKGSSEGTGVGQSPS